MGVLSERNKKKETEPVVKQETKPVEEKQEEAVVVTNQVPAVQVSDWNSLSSYDEAAKVDPNLTRAGWMHEHAKWRTENNMPEMSYSEVLAGMGVGDPYKTKAQEDAEKKKVKRASVLNALGDVFLNLWNVGRTQAGNPAMEFAGVGERGRRRIEQMRQGYDRIAKQNYSVYMDAYNRDKAARDALAAEARKQKAAADLAATKHQYSLELEGEKQKAADAKAKKEHENRLELEGVKAKNAATQAATKFEYDKKIATIRSRGGGSGSNDYLDVYTANGKKRRYTKADNGANWVHQAYQDMIKETGGDESPYKVSGIGLGGTYVPDTKEMYDAVTRYNNDVEANNELNQYKRGGKAAPLE